MRPSARTGPPGHLAALTLLLCTVSVTAPRAQEVVLYGAGSLRESVGQIAEAWGKRHGIPVQTQFGPSGRMRERIERGEPVDVFTSADIGHARTLAASGRASVMAMFARNALCAIAPARLGWTEDTLLDRLLDPALRFGISPARIDPLGDYTEIVFRKAEALRPGAEASLRYRALVLDTPPGAPPPRSGDSTTDAFQDGRIGAAIVYCSGRSRYARLLPDAAMVRLPATLETGPEYGLAVTGTRPEAMSLALAILSPEGQRVMADWGFTPVALPAPP